MTSTGCGKTGAKTGAFQAQIMAFDLMRGYYLSVPADYDANKPYRLVFGYHGSNCTGQMMRQYLDNEKPPLLAEPSSSIQTGCRCRTSRTTSRGC